MTAPPAALAETEPKRSPEPAAPPRRGQRIAAGITVAAIIGLVVSELLLPGGRAWWDRHSFTGDVVSSLLVVGVTVLLLDEVVARRQRRERSLSVAVQALIVFSQALRTQAVVLEFLGEQGRGGSGETSGEVREEVRSLANMILITSPSLFDDIEARLFLVEVQRLAGIMYGCLALGPEASGGRTAGTALAAWLVASRQRVEERAQPLAARVPAAERVRFQQSDTLPGWEG